MPTTRNTRMITALCALAGLWIVVYWIWDVKPHTPRSGGAVVNVREEPEIHWRDVERVDRPHGVFEPIRKDNDPSRTSDADGVGNRSSTGVPAPFSPHVIEHGETWSSIALKYFGDRSLATSLVRANPFKDPRLLREGEVILIPANPHDVQGSGPMENALTEKLDAEDVVSDIPDVPKPSGKPHRVLRNEVLSGISLREYKTVKYARVLFERNKAHLGIEKMELIRPGQVLYLPDQSVIEREYQELLSRGPSE